MDTKKFKFFPVLSEMLPVEIKENSTIAYSPPLSRKSRSTVTGLTNEELETIMPYVVNVGKDHQSFKQIVEEYFDELSWLIPYTGLELDCSMDKNLPVNALHYLLYKVAMQDTSIAKGDDLKYETQFSWKLVDLSIEEKKEKDKFLTTDSALIYYSVLSNKIRQSDKDQATRLFIRRALIVYRSLLDNVTIPEINAFDDYYLLKNLKTICDKYPEKLLEIKTNKDSITKKAYAQLFIDYNLVEIDGDSVFMEGQIVSKSVSNFYVVLGSDNALFAKLQARLRSENLANLEDESVSIELPTPEKTEV